MARRGKGKQLRKVIGIVGDGHTEHEYFSEIKHHENLPNIQIEPDLPQDSGDFRSVFEKAEELVEHGYDKVYAIIDIDDIIHKGMQQQFKNAIQSLSDRLYVIVCNPCFEIWFLLHFSYTTRRFSDCSELIGQMLISYLQGYSKRRNYIRRNSIYTDHLQERLPTAVTNSERLHYAASSFGSGQHHPDCTVHQIIDELEL